MSSITPRKIEKLAMLAVLEPEGTDHLEPDVYEEALDEAGKLLKAAFEILRHRDWYVVGHQWSDTWEPGGGIPFGIEPTENAAREFATTLGGGIYRVAKIYSVGRFLEDKEAMEVAAGLKFADDKCNECNHRAWEHGATKMSRGKVIRDLRASKYPCSTRCKCEGFVQP